MKFALLTRTGFIIALVALVLVIDRPATSVRGANGLDIQLIFDSSLPDAVDPCSPEVLPTCGRDSDLHAAMQAAADHWARIIRDEHTITIRYYWTDLTSPEAAVTAHDGAGRPTTARILFPAGFPWYYDPTPDDDSEFDMVGRLYRTLHPDEKIEALNGTPPEVFEVGYNGQGNEGAPLAFRQGQLVELVTTALHEMGHALGLAGNVSETGPFPSCSQGIPFFAVDPSLVGGALIGIKAFGPFNGAFDCGHLAMGGITACKPIGDEDTLSNAPSTVPNLTIAECTAHQALLWPAAYPRSRAKPSIVDILAVARAGSWSEIHFPRKYSLAGGLWSNESTWLGNRVPEAGDDVFVVNQELAQTAVTANAAAEMANLLISDGNMVVAFNPFAVSGSIVVRDAGSSFDADTSSSVSAGTIDVGEDAILHLWLNGYVDAGTIVNRGHVRGLDAEIEVNNLQNFGTIRANGGTLTFNPASQGAVFDLDATGTLSFIQALTGSLVFNHAIADPLLSDVRVSGGNSITFAQGWAQAASFNDVHRLVMDGTAFDAVIHGNTRLAALVLVNGIGRFTSGVEVGSTTRLNLEIGGALAGSGHDQVVVQQSLSLEGGTLKVELVNGFVPAVNQRFALVLHGPRTGQFTEAILPPLAGGLEFLLLYQADRIEVLVGFAGATPGAPNCSGQASSAQAGLHGGIAKAAAYHGFPSVKAFQDAIKVFCEG